MSLEIQEEKCRKWCQKNGYSLSDEHVYIDAGISSADQRPQLDKMRDAAGKNEFDLVVFYMMSRLFRNNYEQDGFKLHLKAHGIAYVSVAEESVINTINGETEDDEFVATLYGAVNQRERRVIARLTKEAKRKLFKENRLHPGFIPYGYRRKPGYKKGDTSNCVEVHPKTSKVYKRIVDLYLRQGLSSNKIAHILNKEKKPSPRYYHLSDKKKKEYIKLGKKLKWTDSRILKIIENECYTGEKIYLKNTDHPITFKYKPLILKRDWAAMNRLRVGKKKLPKKSHVKVAKNRFLVKSSLGAEGFGCGICSSTIGARVDPRNKNLRYFCYKNSFNVERLKDHGLERCPLPIFDADIVDELVWSKIVHYLSDPEEFNKLWAEAPNIVPLKVEIELLQKKLDKAMEQIKNFTLDLSETTDPDTRKIIIDGRSKAIKEKDDFEQELSFKRDQLKDIKASMSWRESYLKDIADSKKRAEEHRKKSPNGTVGKNGIRRKAIFTIKPVSDHLHRLPATEKKRIIRLFINPIDGGKITMRFDEHGWEKCDFQVRSTMKTIESIINSIGGDDSFIQRLSRPMR